MSNFVMLFNSFLGIYFPVLLSTFLVFLFVEILRSCLDLEALIYEGYMDVWLLLSPLLAFLITLFGIYMFGF